MTVEFYSTLKQLHCKNRFVNRFRTRKAGRTKGRHHFLSTGSFSVFHCSTNRAQCTARAQAKRKLEISEAPYQSDQKTFLRNKKQQLLKKKRVNFKSQTKSGAQI